MGVVKYSSAFVIMISYSHISAIVLSIFVGSTLVSCHFVSVLVLYFILLPSESSVTSLLCRHHAVFCLVIQAQSREQFIKCIPLSPQPLQRHIAGHFFPVIDSVLLQADLLSQLYSCTVSVSISLQLSSLLFVVVYCLHWDALL